MEKAISTLVTEFKTYAGADESSGTLSRDEFQNLVKEQLPNYVKVNLTSCFQPLKLLVAINFASKTLKDIKETVVYYTLLWCLQLLYASLCCYLHISMWLYGFYM